MNSRAGRPCHPASGRAYNDCGRAYNDCGRAYNDCGRAYNDCGRAYNDCGRAYNDCGRAYNDHGRDQTMPRLGFAKRPMFGSTVGRSVALTPNHVARVAAYSSTLVVGIQRPWAVSSGPPIVRLGILP